MNKKTETRNMDVHIKTELVPDAAAVESGTGDDIITPEAFTDDLLQGSTEETDEIRMENELETTEDGYSSEVKTIGVDTDECRTEENPSSSAAQDERLPWMMMEQQINVKEESIIEDESMKRKRERGPSLQNVNKNEQTGSDSSCTIEEETLVKREPLSDVEENDHSQSGKFTVGEIIIPEIKASRLPKEEQSDQETRKHITDSTSTDLNEVEGVQDSSCFNTQSIVCVVEKYPCDDCDMIFDTLHDLSVHRENLCQKVLDGTEDRETASESSSDELESLDHDVALKDKVSIDSQERKNLDTSDESEKRFNTISELKAPLRNPVGVKRHSCPECDKSFTSASYLAIHMCIHAGIKPYTCDECGKSFTQATNLKKHKDLHAGVKPYTCKECEKSFSSRYNLMAHERTHTGVKPYTCKECGKSFTTNSHLTAHERIHTGVKPYTCEECGKSFNRTSHLTVHVRIHKGVKPYICEECGKSFNQRAYLIVHQRIHTGVKPYICEHCGKSFAAANRLKRHEVAHTDERSYICDECGKAFFRPDELRKHQTTHTGVKPYTCEDCGKSFTTTSHLKAHERIHTGVKPFTCKDCGKSFNTNSHLKVHERIHTGVKPYICETCGKSFTTTSQLTNHARTHTGVKPYTCDECGKLFSRSGDLARHQRRLHSYETLQ